MISDLNTEVLSSPNWDFPGPTLTELLSYYRLSLSIWKFLYGPVCRPGWTQWCHIIWKLQADDITLRPLHLINYNQLVDPHFVTTRSVNDITKRQGRTDATSYSRYVAAQVCVPLKVKSDVVTLPYALFSRITRSRKNVLWKPLEN